MRLKLIHALQRATHGVGLYLARHDAHGLTQAEGHVLSLLAQSHPRTIGELHEGLAHKRSTLTSILDRLAQRELITREPSPTDRRTFVIDLTAEGKRVAQGTLGLLADLEARVLDELPTRDVAGFLKVVQALDQAAHEREAAGKSG
jgi:DNA-binding MarR family transcriptional regulator